MDEQRVKEGLISLLSVGDLINIYSVQGYPGLMFKIYSITEDQIYFCITENKIYFFSCAYIKKSDIEYVDGELHIPLEKIQNL